MDTATNGTDASIPGDKINDKENPQPSDAEGDMEEEPRLKYQRMGSDVADLLGRNAATCLCVSDKILALGTHSGTVHVLDYNGNEVRRGAVLASCYAISREIVLPHQRNLYNCRDA